MYTVAICDDESKILEGLHARIADCFNNHRINAGYFCTDDSKQMMTYLQRKKVDVLFLDIDMPHISGMDIAAYLNENRRETILVFVTSHDALVYQTFAYRPFGFIRKAYLNEELEELTERIECELQERRQELTISKGQEIVRVRIHEIVYIEAEGNYLSLYTTEDVHKVRETMVNMEQELCRKGFIRCHKGYLVNLQYVERLKSAELLLQWKERRQAVPVGRSYEKEVRKKILDSIRN